MPSPRRIAEFVVWAEGRSPDEIGVLLGVAPDRSDPTCWLLAEHGTGSETIDLLVSNLLRRLEPAWDTIVELCSVELNGCALRIVAYIDDDRDKVGAGFAFGADFVRRLADANAFLEFDLYG